MQFIKHQELQTPCCTDQLVALLRPGQEQFEHHVVGEQDVRWVREDRLSLLVGLLSGVSSEGHRFASAPESVGQELLEFMPLGVRQCVHRIDHDCLDRLAATMLVVTQHPVNDRDDVGQ